MKVEPQQTVVDEVAITVTVTGQSRDFAGKLVHSEAHDLQVFRDGQIVASFPNPGGRVILDPETNSKTVLIPHVRIPYLAGKKDVEFSAYAFNVDRVKSNTARLIHPLPVDAKPRPRTAYVIAIGVNASDDPRLALHYAVQDAKTLASIMEASFKAQRQFENVVVVPLLSESETKADERSATKATIHAVLQVLAGQNVDARFLKHVPNASKLATARPEDLLLMSFSTHGHNGTDGQFHLLPSDNKQAISTADLTRWLRDVDAGEIVLIVDACHSAGAVEQKGFKPGPMGSRGFGQMAYNKRMATFSPPVRRQMSRSSTLVLVMDY